MSRCFVPYCDSGSAKRIRLNKLNGCRNAILFSVPEDDIMFRKWKRVIRRTDKDLESTDRVCEKHFLDNVIQRSYEETVTDGTVSRVEKGLPTLKPWAVPSMFPGGPRSEPVVKKCEQSPALEVQQTEVNTVKIKEVFANFDVTSFLSQDLFNFEILKQEASLLPTPDASWASNCLENSIVWAKWTGLFALERQLVITPDLHAKVFLKGKEIDLASMVPLDSRAAVGDLLNRINALVICPGIERQSPGCLGYKENGLPDSLELHISVCKSCYTNNKTLPCYALGKQALISRDQKRTQQLQETKQRNIYLQRQVDRLKDKTKILKTQCDLALKGL